MVNKILLAVDGSENSMRAARHTAALMKKNPGLKVTILYVRSPVENLLKFSPWVQPQIIESETKKIAENIIERAKSVFTGEGFYVETDVVMGDAGEAIVKYAEEGKFGQIIMGTRGLSDLSGIILGSVSHQVLHLAKPDCPIMLVK
jgi:nucleotide-binding universal stress UspA family protein